MLNLYLAETDLVLVHSECWNARQSITFFVVSCDYTLIGEELFAALLIYQRSSTTGFTKRPRFWKTVSYPFIVVRVKQKLYNWHWFKHF
jgi:hypothetical protein